MIPSDFLLLADALPEVLVLISDQAEIVAANRAAGQFLGVVPDKFQGRPLQDLVDISGDLLAKHMRIWARTRMPVPAPIVWRTRAGTPRGWRCQAFLLQPRDKDNPAYIVLRCMPGRRSASEFTALNRELEKQQMTLRKLRESREVIALEHEKAVVTLRSIGDAVITTDREGRVESMNAIASKLTGWSEHDVAGRPLLEVFNIVNEETREAVVDPVARCLKEGRIVGLANHTVLIAHDGTEYVIEDSAAPIRDLLDRVLGAVLVFRDATEDRLIQRQLHYLAQHDTLTALYNRHFFEHELGRAVQVTTSGGLAYAMLYMDLDQFKLVNDTAGHGAGDDLLRELAHLFSGRTRPHDILARLGGDEFGVLLSGADAQEAMAMAENLLRAMEHFSFIRQGVTYDISTSIGIATVDRSTASAAEVLRRADIACYVAKRDGRNRFHVYSEQDDVDLAALGEVNTVNDIKAALTADRFVLHFQPILHTNGGNGGLYEVLVRMLGKDDELIGPTSIIPTAERFGLMGQIDCWVVSRALHVLSELHRNGADLSFSINLSGVSVGDQGLLQLIKRKLGELGVNPSRLVFEVTETAAIAVTHIEKAGTFIRELRAMGCRFALDDFGTGFSSFTYLKYLPVDFIKIDGTFVRDVLTDPVDQAMVRSINQIAHSLDMETIAEFVESEEILDELKIIGVDYAQGCHIGEPTPIPG